MINLKIKTFGLLLLLGGIFAMGCRQNEKSRTTQPVMQKGKIKVAVLIYPGVELLDFAGPAEVFSDSKYFQVYTVSTGSAQINTEGNTLSINPDFTISNAPQPDVLVIPGAPMNTVGGVASDHQVISWINKISAQTKLTMSVCTGAGLLSRAGLLDGKTVTTHFGAIDTLQKLTPKAKFISNVRFVEDGKILTTAGVSAGIDGALHIVEKLKGLKEALFVTAVMEYDKWNPADGKVMGAMENDKGMDMNMMHHENTTAVSEMKSPLPKTINEEEKDVVCGMTVPKGSSKYHLQYKGKDYHFCSATCRNLFNKNAALYTSKK
ncbi:DJ-1/PfpI family protein [Pedobacter lusitanus]|uniref:DJ-1/PfpI family protein n=1 Tax=Pedobacter lusitanus TaxID=1503925 RepID=UPI00069842AA|nr:DJ-1/PfpI family protein [Pedobacter lusitanus]